METSTSKVDLVHRKLLKFALGVSKSCPNLAVYGEIGETPLSFKGYRLTLNFWHRVTNLPETALVKKAMLENIKLKLFQLIANSPWVSYKLIVPGFNTRTRNHIDYYVNLVVVLLDLVVVLLDLVVVLLDLVVVLLDLVVVLLDLVVVLLDLVVVLLDLVVVLLDLVVVLLDLVVVLLDLVAVLLDLVVVLLDLVVVLLDLVVVLLELVLVFIEITFWIGFIDV